MQCITTANAAATYDQHFTTHMAVWRISGAARASHICIISLQSMRHIIFHAWVVFVPGWLAAIFGGDLCVRGGSGYWFDIYGHILCCQNMPLMYDEADDWGASPELVCASERCCCADNCWKFISCAIYARRHSGEWKENDVCVCVLFVVSHWERRIHHKWILLRHK